MDDDYTDNTKRKASVEYKRDSDRRYITRKADPYLVHGSLSYYIGEEYHDTVTIYSERGRVKYSRMPCKSWKRRERLSPETNKWYRLQNIKW